MIEHVMSATNPWGVPGLVTATTWLVAAVTLAVAGRWRTLARRTMMRTTDPDTLAFLGEGMAEAWALTGKTVLVATTITLVMVAAGAAGSRSWASAALLPALLAAAIMWWRRAYMPGRDMDLLLSTPPQEGAQ